MIQRSETCFVEHCLRFCERVDSCRRQALQTGNPMILGEDVVQLLASMSLPRALEIIEGATPGSDMERDFVQRVARVRAYEV